MSLNYFLFDCNYSEECFCCAYLVYIIELPSSYTEILELKKGELTRNEMLILKNIIIINFTNFENNNICELICIQKLIKSVKKHE